VGNGLHCSLQGNNDQRQGHQLKNEGTLDCQMDFHGIDYCGLNCEKKCCDGETCGENEDCESDCLNLSYLLSDDLHKVSNCCCKNG